MLGQEIEWLGGFFGDTGCDGEVDQVVRQMLSVNFLPALMCRINLRLWYFSVIYSILADFPLHAQWCNIFSPCGMYAKEWNICDPHFNTISIYIEL